jgi:hypothetical protein
VGKRERKLAERLATEAAWYDNLYEEKSTGTWMRSSLRPWLYSLDTARAADHVYREKVDQNLPVRVFLIEANCGTIVLHGGRTWTSGIHSVCW